MKFITSIFLIIMLVSCNDKTNLSSTKIVKIDINKDYNEVILTFKFGSKERATDICVAEHKCHSPCTKY